MHWREWMDEKLKQGKPPPNFLKELGFLGPRPGLEAIANRLDKAGRHDIDWALVRFVHLDKIDPNAAEWEAFMRVFARLQAKSYTFGPPKGHDKFTGRRPTDKRVKTIMDEAAFQLVHDDAVKVAKQPDGTSLAMRFAYYMGIRRNDLIHISLSDFFEIDGDLTFYANKRLITVPEHMLDDTKAWMAKRRDSVRARKGMSNPLFPSHCCDHVARHKDMWGTLSALKKLRA